MKFASPPAFSFSSKPVGQVETTPMITPGPGAYDVRREIDFQTKSCRIGSGIRRDLSPVGTTPGPGSYEVLGNSGNPHGKVSPKRIQNKGRTDPNNIKDLKDRVNRMLPDYPGPGTYNPTKKSSGPSLPFGNKTYSFLKASDLTPGPGSYSPKPNEIKPEIAIKSGLRSSLSGLLGSHGPGPAAYNTRRANDSPKYGFGTGPKMLRSSSSAIIPGPGQYSIPTSSPGKSSTISGKPTAQSLRMSYGPGPGSYSPKEVVASRAFGIGKGNRTAFIVAKELPGPGEYNPSHPVQMVIHTAKLDLSARRPLGGYYNTPGPGTYDIPGLADSGLKPSLSGRRGEFHKLNGAPGPGAYEPTFSHIDYHRAMASIGSSQRTDLAHGSISPGPKYDIRTQPNPPFWSFRKEGPKMEQFIDGVGPGEYPHVATVPDAPKYAFSKNKK